MRMQAATAASLYAIAQRKHWSVDSALDWTAQDWRSDFPCLATGNPFAGFAPYEALPRLQRIGLAWAQHGGDISDILMGEWAALTLAAQLLIACDDPARRLFFSAQVADEARHATFFERYLTVVVGDRPGGSEPLKQLVGRAIRSPSLWRKQLVCQGIIEPLALAQFRHLRAVTRVPLLRAALTLILADEARHLACQHPQYAPRRPLSPVQERACQRFMDHAITRLVASLDRWVAIGVGAGLPAVPLRRHLARYRQRQWPRHG